MAVYVIRRVDQQKMEMKGGRAMMIQALFRCTCTQTGIELWSEFTHVSNVQ